MIKYIAGIVFIYAISSIFRITTSLAPDFSVFYDAARGLVAHQNVYTLPMYTGLGYPPFTLLPFIPFTLLPYPLAQTIWIGSSFLLFLLCIYLSLPKPTIRSFCTVFIFAFLAFPTKFTLGMGQINFAALALLLLALRYKSGFFLGLLFVIKPHFLLFLPLFGLRYLLPAVLTLGLSIFLTGFTLYGYYFQTVVPQLMIFVGRGLYYNQGLGAFLSRLLPNALAGELTFWISALLVIGGLWFIWNKKLTLQKSILFFIPIFLLVEPLSWQHHYVFLLPVFVWLWYRTKHRLLLLLSYVLVAINIPFAQGMFLSHVFFGNVLLLSLVTYELS